MQSTQLYQFTCTFDPTMGKFLFQSTVSFVVDFSENNLCYNMGLGQFTYNSISLSNNNILQTGVIFLNTPPFISLTLDNLCCNNVINNNKKSASFIIPISSYNFSDILYLNKSNYDVVLNVGQ